MSADLLARLIASGTPPDLVAELAMELARGQQALAALERRRSTDRTRQHNRRTASRDITLDNVSARDTADTKESPPDPHKKIYTPGEAGASPAPKGAGQKGSRIPVDWTPPPIDKLPPQTRALVRQWPAGAYEVEAEAHVNYWLSETGPKARKVDWDRTWFNRIAQVTAAVLRGARAGVRYDTIRTRDKIERDYAQLARHAQERAAFYDKMGRTDDAAEQRRAAERFWHLQAAAAGDPLAAAGGT